VPLETVSDDAKHLTIEAHLLSVFDADVFDRSGI
jgi:hypothetical protein